MCAKVLARVVVEDDAEMDPVFEIAFDRNNRCPLSGEQQVECVRPAAGLETHVLARLESRARPNCVLSIIEGRDLDGRD